MRFSTETGSVYEVDGSRIRRLIGTHEPTPHQGTDGEWRSFEHISPILEGMSVAIVWGDVPEAMDEDGRVLIRRQRTFTSPVKHVQEIV